MRVLFVTLCFIFLLWLACRMLMLMVALSAGFIGFASILIMTLFIFERSRL